VAIFGNQVIRLLREKWPTATGLAEELYALLQSDTPIEVTSPLDVKQQNPNVPAMTITNSVGGSSFQVNGGSVDFSGDTAVNLGSNAFYQTNDGRVPLDGTSGRGISSVVLAIVGPREPALAIYEPGTGLLTLQIPRSPGIEHVSAHALAADQSPTASYDPETETLDLGIPGGGSGAGGGLLGRIAGGDGATYSCDLYGNGPASAPTSGSSPVTVHILDGSAGDHFDAGTWLLPVLKFGVDDITIGAHATYYAARPRAAAAAAVVLAKVVSGSGATYTCDLYGEGSDRPATEEGVTVTIPQFEADDALPEATWLGAVLTITYEGESGPVTVYEAQPPVWV
jgi:hypothetical protein